MHIRRILALGALALFGVTYRLWTPQHLFPRVPLIEACADWPESLDSSVTWSLSALCLLATVTLLLSRLSSKLIERVSVAVFCIALAGLCILDQHRMQPWAVQIGLCLCLITLTRGTHRLSSLTWLIASIYVYSALSKFDAQFLYTVGQEFLRTLLAMIGLQASDWGERSRFWLAATFPVFELICGLGLLHPVTRKTAAVGAIGMHTILIVILGPWGLNHSWGVLLWNILFVALDLIVFFIPRLVLEDDHAVAAMYGERNGVEVAPDRGAMEGKVSLWLAKGLLCLAIIAPAFERVGLLDHWLGWALYAPHSSRAQLRILQEQLPRLPAVVHPFVVQDEADELPWCRVQLDHWSLSTLGVPIYPQQRFYVAVIRGLTERLDEYQLDVMLQSTASRWSGRRSQQAITSRSELEQAARRYWFGAKPRSLH